MIPKLSMSGLADYDRNTGYVKGDVNLTHQTVVCGFDRGIMFNVDALDDAETAGIAFGRLAGEFIRTQVVPELDAYRIAQYASTPNIGKATPAELNTGSAVVEALRATANAMDEDEMPLEGRVLFITPTLYGLVEDLDTTKSRAVLARWAQIVQVPQSRMYTAIEQTTNGYQKDAAGVNINFLAVHKAAAIQYQKHVAPKVITPEANQSADGWAFGYRNVGIAEVFENKVAGVYLHAALA